MTNISFEIANLTFFLIFEIEKSTFWCQALKLAGGFNACVMNNPSQTLKTVQP